MTGNWSSPDGSTPAGAGAYINGGMVPARVLAERLEGFVEIVGQHDPLSLTRPKALRALIDLRLDSPEYLTAYRAAWKRAQELESVGAEWGGDLRALEREQDLLAYQIREIERAGFRIGEDAELVQLANRLGNAEEIGELLAGARRELAAARDRIGPAVGALRRVCDLDPSQDGLREMLEGLDATLTEAATVTREAWEGIDMDPQALALVNERLSLLGDLRRKYGSGIEEILAFRDSAQARHTEVGGLLERAATIDADREAVSRELDEAGRALREARCSAASVIVEDATAPPV